MLVHPQFDPVALALGPVQVHWYGLTYLLAFGLFLFLAGLRVRQPSFAGAGWARRDVEDLLFFGVVGVVLGGRVGYALFYKPDYYLQHPLEILMVWKGGMSFHGGLLGVVLAVSASHRPDRPLRAHRSGQRAHRQLHQWRALGPAGRSLAALGDGVSAVGQHAAAAPFAALPVPAGGFAAVCLAVVVRPAHAPDG